MKRREKMLFITKKQPETTKKLGGFTIIEVLIALFVTSIGIIGVFNVFSIIVVLSSDLTNRLIATYLAQEGMEIVRNIRDNNWLKIDICIAKQNQEEGCPASWIDGLADNKYYNNPVDCTNGCQADYASERMEIYSPTNYLNLGSNDLYTYTEDQNVLPTKFKRKITIQCIPNGECDNTDYAIKVKTEVAWDQKATLLSPAISAQDALNNCAEENNCVVAEETLYNWYNTTFLVTSVKITNPESGTLTMRTNEVRESTAEVIPPYATNKEVVWSSDDEDCITIESSTQNNNESTARIKAGADPCETYVTVTTIDGNFKAEILVTVQNEE